MIANTLSGSEWEKVRKQFNPKGCAFTDFTLSQIARDYDLYLTTGAHVFLESAQILAIGRRKCDWITFLGGLG